MYSVTSSTLGPCMLKVNRMFLGDSVGRKGAIAALLPSLNGGFYKDFDPPVSDLPVVLS